MIEWLGALAFGELMLLASVILTAVAGYITLNTKVSYLIEKDKVRAQKLEELESSFRADIASNRTFNDARFAVLDERQRASDVLTGRIEERLNSMTTTLDKIYTQLSKESK
jgi:hypothetical protein